MAIILYILGNGIAMQRRQTMLIPGDQRPNVLQRGKQQGSGLVLLMFHYDTSSVERSLHKQFLSFC